MLIAKHMLVLVCVYVLQMIAKCTLDSTLFYHGSASLYLTLYITLFWLYFTLLVCTLLYYSSTLYHGSIVHVVHENLRVQNLINL